MVYFVLPYFPQWAKGGLGKAIASINKLWATKIGLQIRISWKLSGTHLVSLLKGFNSSFGYDALEHSVIRRVR